jgi:hypothetical protein
MGAIDQKEQEVKNGLDTWLATKMGIEGFGDSIPVEGPLSGLFRLGIRGIPETPSDEDEEETPLAEYLEEAKQEIASSVQIALLGNADEGIPGALPAIQQKQVEAVLQLNLAGERQANRLEFEVLRAGRIESIKPMPGLYGERQGGIYFLPT